MSPGISASVESVWRWRSVTVALDSTGDLLLVMTDFEKCLAPADSPPGSGVRFAGNDHAHRLKDRCAWFLFANGPWGCCGFETRPSIPFLRFVMQQKQLHGIRPFCPWISSVASGGDNKLGKIPGRARFPSARQKRLWHLSVRTQTYNRRSISRPGLLQEPRRFGTGPFEIEHR